jgi:hypothetical protein
MTKRVVDLEDFSRTLGDYSTRHLKDRKRAVMAGIAKSIPDLVAASPVDTGLYAQSWMMTETETSAIIGNSAPYAGIIEYGARPHKPPLGPLLAWAKRVTGSSSQPPDYEPHVWAIAIAVQKKIEEQGQQPKHILENMIPKIISNIREELKRGR